MTKELYIQNTKIRYLFYLLMSGILVWFLILQAFGTNERDINEVSGMPVYHGSFTWQKSDGSSEKITVPGRYSVSPEDTMIITSTLPEDYDSNTLAVRSSLQSVRFYINGKLRSEYDTKDTRLAGKNSASRYVFCKTSDADAGKELRIELRTNTKQYSGVVNTVYCGDKIDIWEFLFTQYGMETITAFFIPNSTWNILDGACLWDQSGCSVNQNFASFWFRTPPHLPLCALLFSCSPLFRYSFMPIRYSIENTAGSIFR